MLKKLKTTKKFLADLKRERVPPALKCCDASVNNEEYQSLMLCLLMLSFAVLDSALLAHHYHT